MRKFIFLALIIVGISSCGSKSIFLENKNNYIIQDNEKYISANYKTDKTINSDSQYQLKIFNARSKDIYIFSTVLENSSMFYSKKNFKQSGKTIFFNSYYKNFMADATHSGERKFNFIIIPPNDFMTINIKSELLRDIETIQLKYYYFILDKNSNLINIDKYKLIDSTLKVTLQKTRMK